MSDAVVMEEGKGIVLSSELKGLEKSKAVQIEAVFAPMVEMLKSFEASFDEVMGLDPEDPETAKRAKRLRLDISHVRIDAEKIRKDQKEEYLRAGKAIDGVNNILKFAVVEKENKLKEIETYQERKEAERLEKLDNERISLLSGLEINGEGLNLGAMPEMVWNNYYAGAKANYKAKKEAERKAEEERIKQEKKKSLYNSRREILLPLSAFITPGLLTLDTTEEQFSFIHDEARKKKADHEEEQARIKAENERLRKEKEEADKKAEQERLEREAKEKKEREKREAEERVRREKEEQARKEREAEAEAHRKALDAERAKREEAEKKAEEERKAREEQARKEREAREAEERRKATAPDKEKILSGIAFLRGLNCTDELSKSAVMSACITLQRCIKELDK